MNKDHLVELQRTVATLAFTHHFNMSRWAESVDTRPPGCANACGTSLCLAGLATMLDLSSTDSSFQPTVETLSSEQLYPSLCEVEIINNSNENTLLYVARGSRYLGIPYSCNARIWHHTYWPAPLRSIYSPLEFKDTWPHYRNGDLNAVYQTYLDTRPKSHAINYDLPISYFRALAGYLALETFYRFQDVVVFEGPDWVTASQLAICNPAQATFSTTLTRWLNYYSVKISDFEKIALNTPSAQTFLK